MSNGGVGLLALFIGWLSILWGWSLAWIANIPFLIYTKYLLKGELPPAIPVYVTVGLAFSVLLPLHTGWPAANYIRGYSVYMWLMAFAVLGGYTAYVKVDVSFFD
jgi:hypothetical protein